tara:strand:+ start:3938 stop:4693 length:756 start_codon:yes stop_codon:yes gene_type:complete
MINKKKVVASIEARMGSSRLPGKVLKNFGNETALSLLVKRLKKCKRIDAIVVATTTEKKDEPIINWCLKNNIYFFRGSEKDVLDRVVKAHEYMKSEIIVEITGDCPFTDPEIVDLAVETFFANNVDLVTNCGNHLTWPLGQYVQVFPYYLLKDVNEKIDDECIHEHVSLYFYENPNLYKIFELIAPRRWQYPNFRLVLDYKEDFIFLNKIYDYLYKKYGINFGIEEIIKYLVDYPENLEINKNCIEKKARI